jgi:Spy/CpxP family protein refolding chaperone
MSTELLDRASTVRGWDARLAVGAVLLVVFLCGAAAGALAMDSKVHLRMHQPDFDTPNSRALNFDRLQRELNLTPPQAEQVSSILADMWQYYRTVLTDSKSRVEQVLTPHQREKFEQLLRDQR